ncbi:hypothetical protein ACVWY2_004941 [Bradyrhizobium sp. JR6.1]
MSAFFGPLDSEGRVPPRQQTRAAAFLTSAHGALARQFAFALPPKLESAWQTELNAQFYHEAEIVSLLLRATTWVPDVALGYMAMSWETAWFPRPPEEIPDRPLALALDLATLAHAVHAGITAGSLAPARSQCQRPLHDGAAPHRIRKRPTPAGTNPVPQGFGTRAISRGRQRGS